VSKCRTRHRCGRPGVTIVILGRPSSGQRGDFIARIMQENGYELQVIAACQHTEVLVNQLLKLLGEGPHGAVLDDWAAMVTSEGILTY
jgi:hypothetical protein